MLDNFLKRKMNNIFGWKIEDGKVSPPKFDFPDFVWDRIEMSASEFENGLTFTGALKAVLAYDEKKSEEEWDLGACTEWVPVTQEFIKWRDNQPDVSMELAVALIYGSTRPEVPTNQGSLFDKEGEDDE